MSILRGLLGLACVAPLALPESSAAASPARDGVAHAYHSRFSHTGRVRHGGSARDHGGLGRPRRVFHRLHHGRLFHSWNAAGPVHLRPCR
jgi:hypothetical protein